MKQLETVGARLDHALTRFEQKTASPVAQALLGVGMGLVVLFGGLVALFVFLKLLTALF